MDIFQNLHYKYERESYAYKNIDIYMIDIIF